MDIFISGRAHLCLAASYAFVRFQDLESTRTAIHKLNGVVMDGRRLKVSVAWA